MIITNENMFSRLNVLIQKSLKQININHILTSMMHISTPLQLFYVFLDLIIVSL